jgi:hypothetical protein
VDGAELVLFMLKLEVGCLDVALEVAGDTGGVCLFCRTARRLAGGCGAAAAFDSSFLMEGAFLSASGMMGDCSLVAGVATVFLGLELVFSVASWLVKGSNCGVSEPRNRFAKLDELNELSGELDRIDSCFGSLRGVVANKLSLLVCSAGRVSETDLLKIGGLDDDDFDSLSEPFGVDEVCLLRRVGSMRAWRRLMKLPMLSFILGSSPGWLMVRRVRNGDFWRWVMDGAGEDGVTRPALSRLWVDFDLQKASKRSRAALTNGSSSSEVSVLRLLFR